MEDLVKMTDPEEKELSAGTKQEVSRNEREVSTATVAVVWLKKSIKPEYRSDGETLDDTVRADGGV